MGTLPIRVGGDTRSARAGQMADPRRETPYG